ncbi:ComEC/Rec2 family competence protein [Desertivirga arenae]|uniref:ComEC/Rec2 family competence protein n=1 Tax=Desertivirga arenae TaxID=2810309 RepID=UPI001A971D24|nr:ComEC/Rec2 family competence protein [Pedobacter sp. SYSU D00823]
MKNVIYKGELVFVRVLTPVIGAIITALLFPNLLLLSIAIKGSLVSLATLIILWYLYKALDIYFYRWLPGCVLHIFLFSLGLSITLSEIDSIQPDYYAKIRGQAFMIRVKSEPRLANGLLRFESQVLKVFNETGAKTSRGKLLVSIRTDGKSNPKYGDDLIIPNKLAEIDPPYNPFEFDYKSYLKNQGLEKQVFLNVAQYRVIGSNKGNGFVSSALRLRKKLVAGFSEYIKDKEAAALASTLVLGYRAELSAEIITAYSKTGTMHVLSVSGMHVLLVFSILTVLLSFLDKNVWLRVLKVMLIISAVWFYAMLTGFSSAVCRAAVMCTIYVIGKTFNRRTNSYNTLAASALLLLLYNPFFLLDAGFQLSYLAVAGLVYLYPKIRHLFFFKNRIIDTIWTGAAVSIAAQVATLPLSLYYFHQFPLYFLIANLLITVPIQVVMYIGIGFLILFSFKASIPISILEVVGWFLKLCIECIDSGLIYIGKLSFSSLSFYPYGAAYYFAFFIFTLLLMISIQFKNKKTLFLSLLAFAFISIYTSFEQVKRNNREEVIIYSLRKNRAIAFFRGDECLLYTDLQPHQKNYSFSIQPSLSAFASHVKIVNSTVTPDSINPCNYFFSFRNWRLMIWDNRWNRKHFNKSIKVNTLLLTNNVKIDLRKLMDEIQFSLLLIDATNREYRIKQWVEQAQKLGIKYYVLKHHPAFRIVIKS